MSLGKYIFFSLYLVAFSFQSSFSQTFGCTDELANNYNFAATMNDGSCIYPDVSLSPINSIDLDSNLKETSGLIQWNNKLWTINDSDDSHIYGLDTLTGEILETIELLGVENTDWEAIEQDNENLYIGNFGNNAHGNRTDLSILKISKLSILSGNPSIETIEFYYSDQSDFSAQDNNTSDYDCEAFIVSDDQIFLFTKQWNSLGTKVYSLPKTDGIYQAQYITEYQVDGLITDASLIVDQSIILLSGYSELLQPFVYLIYDFEQPQFFQGNKRKIQLNLPFRQIEGISSIDGKKVFLSNEYFSPNSLIEVQQQLHIGNLNELTGNYLFIDVDNSEATIQAQPNPTKDFLTIDISKFAKAKIKQIQVFNFQGKIEKKINLKNNTNVKLDVRGLKPGVYYINFIGTEPIQSIKFQKIE
jgi:hypothetical protein